MINIEVGLRIRPQNDKEIFNKDSEILEILDENSVRICSELIEDSSKNSKNTNFRSSFTFSNINNKNN